MILFADITHVRGPTEYVFHNTSTVIYYSWQLVSMMDSVHGQLKLPASILLLLVSTGFFLMV